MAGKVRSLTVSEGTELSGAPTLDPIEASEVSYNNVASGMTADNVQAAIDENDARHDTHDAHEANMANPHGVDANDVGLGNVDNTSDADKPISTATQTALDGKLDDFPSTTDNALVRTDGVAGDTVQDTGILVDDSDNMSGVADLTLDGSIDKASAAPLDIGGTNATDVNIGRTGQTTVVKGNLQVDGTTTTVNSETLDVVDENITVNKGGNKNNADGSAGITVEMSDETDAVITYRQTSASKFQIGSVGSEVDIADISSEQILSNKRIYDLQLEYIPDGSTTGSNADVVAAPQTIRHFSNASLVSIDTLAAGENGHTYVWVNKTGNPFTINNDAGANGFLTGTGANLVVEADASIWIQYDLPSTRWRVIGGSGAPSGGGGGGLEVEFKSTDFTAEAGKHYRCTSGVSAITMPTIADGDQIAISPSEGAEWSTNSITVSPAAGQSIDGAVADEDYILNQSGVDKVSFTGKASTTNWEVDTPVTPNAPSTAIGFKVSMDSPQNATTGGGETVAGLEVDSALFDFDTNSGWDTGADEYTIPTSGKWTFSCAALVTGMAANNWVNLRIDVDTGSGYNTALQKRYIHPVAIDAYIDGPTSTLNLNSGDKVRFFIATSSTTFTFGRVSEGFATWLSGIFSGD